MLYALCYVVKLKIFTLFRDYNKIEIDNNEERSGTTEQDGGQARCPHQVMLGS